MIMAMRLRLDWPHCPGQVIGDVGNRNGHIRPKAKTNSLAREAAQIAVPDKPHIAAKTKLTLGQHELITMNHGRRHRQISKPSLEPGPPEPPP